MSTLTDDIDHVSLIRELYHALVEVDVDAVQYVLSKGLIDVNERCLIMNENWEFTPLYLILRQEDSDKGKILEIVKLLIEKYGANPHSTINGFSYLMIAKRLKGGEEIVQYLLSKGVDPLLIEVETALNAHSVESKELKGRNENIAGQFLYAPENLVRLFLVINNSTQAMIKDPNSRINLFNTLKTLPKHFMSAKFKITPLVNLPFFGVRINQVKILVAHNTPYTERSFRDNRGSFLTCVEFFNAYHPKNHRNVVVQLTLENGSKHMLTIQSREDAYILNDIVATTNFYEECYMGPEPACSVDQWKGLEIYENTEQWFIKENHDRSNKCFGEVSRFYDEILHPEMTKDILASVKEQRIKNAIVIEIGAGTGELSKRLFQALSQVCAELHVFATDIVESSVDAGNASVVERARIDKNKSIEFFIANSIYFLTNLEKTHALEKIRKLQEDHIQKYNEAMPIYVVSSGALNRVVLNNTFESARVLQNIFRLQPRKMVVSGLTETLVSQHILKNLGFDTILRRAGDFSSEDETGHYYQIQPQALNNWVGYFENKLRKYPRRLDLSLNSDPLIIIKMINPQLLVKVVSIDISFAFFRDGKEVTEFLTVLHAKCPSLSLKNIQYGYHFPEDLKLLEEGASEYRKTNPAAVAIYSTLVAEEQAMGFTKRFIERVTNIDYIFTSFKENLGCKQAKTKIDKKSQWR